MYWKMKNDPFSPHPSLSVPAPDTLHVPWHPQYLGHCSSCRFCPAPVGNQDFPNFVVKILIIGILLSDFGKAGSPGRWGQPLGEWLERDCHGQVGVLQPHSRSCQAGLCKPQAQASLCSRAQSSQHLLGQVAGAGRAHQGSAVHQHQEFGWIFQVKFSSSRECTLKFECSCIPNPWFYLDLLGPHGLKVPLPHLALLKCFWSSEGRVTASYHFFSLS